MVSLNSCGPSILMTGGIKAPPAARLFLCSFLSALGRTVRVGSPLTILREKRETSDTKVEATHGFQGFPVLS